MSQYLDSVAIIGAGRMGASLAARLAALGIQVNLGSRTPDSDQIRTLTSQIPGKIYAIDVKQAVDASSFVAICVPYSGLRETLTAIGALNGKLVIDVTNALAMNDDGLMMLACETSAGEEIQDALPNARVVKAFNTLGFHVLKKPDLAGGPVSVMLAGNDAAAKETAADLAHRIGFEAVDVGPIRQSRYLEGMSALYLTPYLQGRKDEAFEYHLRCGTAPQKSQGVRAAG